MIKIKVSYEHPEELEWLEKRLGRNVIRIKAPKQQEGKFRRAYIICDKRQERRRHEPEAEGHLQFFPE